MLVKRIKGCCRCRHILAAQFSCYSKSEVAKLDINRLVNVSTGLNNLKTKVDDLDVGKLNTAAKN